MNDNNKPKMPEPLSLYVLHSPAEVRAHRKRMDDYRAAVHANERAEAQRLEDEKTHANRTLTEDEYFSQAVERDKLQRARNLEREAAEFAAEQQRKEKLAASPDIAEVLTNNVGQFITELQSWIRRGYSVTFDGPFMFLPNLCHITLTAPAKKTKGAAA